MTMFDNYLMVDWSSNKKPKTGADSIWLAWVKKDEQIKFFNPDTRTKALEKITELLKSNGRTIIGFDFPFGYPADAYDEFKFKNAKCENWKNLWKLISYRIKDNHDNSNNRFEIANKLNLHFKGESPFWGRDANHTQYKNISTNKPTRFAKGSHDPLQFRTIETYFRKAKSVWQLAYNGCVGAQTLMGIPYLSLLKKRGDCLIWPFASFNEIDNSDKHVIAEIYPSIWNEEEKNIGLCKDAGQVKTVVQQIFCQDKKGDLKNLLNEPYNHDKKDIITEKEGWILGVNKTGEVAKIIKENRPYILYD